MGLDASLVDNDNIAKTTHLMSVGILSLAIIEH